MNNFDFETEIRKLRKLACEPDFEDGMERFSAERSAILRLTYHCLRNSKNDFSQCQSLAWKQYKKLKNCMEEYYE